MGINRIPASVVQYTQYYPSGLPWESNSGDNPDLQHKKYNGKEFIEMNGLNALDYGARLMFPDRGPVFSGVDPLTEDFYDISPYVYGLNNPLRYTDPTGMAVSDTIKSVELPELNVIAKRNNPIGSRAMNPVSGFWGWTEHLLFGNTYTSGKNSNGIFPVIKATWIVNSDGIITEVQPLTGTPPISIFKGGSVFIKGYKFVDKLIFHKKIKPQILKEVRKLHDFSRIVGTNPDITVVDSKIFLQGAKNSPFAGKILNTELNVIDFFK